MTRPAAIYARVSSDRQKEVHTIASQTAALIQFAETEGFAVPKEWVFQDEGYFESSRPDQIPFPYKRLADERFGSSRNPCTVRNANLPL